MPLTTQGGFTVVRWVWYTEGGHTRPIGIVLGYNRVGEWRSYIGTGSGYDETADIEQVAAYGAMFPVDVAAGLMRYTITESAERGR